jgi:GNAT superfamily N-acetyltransferase
MDFLIRSAEAADIPELRKLIDSSVRGLQANDYTQAQMEGALENVYGVDTNLIADGTYFVVEAASPKNAMVGCGGWSRRKTLFGGDQFARREDETLDPAHDPAKIRAFFVHPEWARRGIATLILETCERAAGAAGFTRLEMGATLTGVPFYRARGYREVERIESPLAGGTFLEIVRMEKTLA